MKEVYLQPCFGQRTDDVAHGVNPLVSRVFAAIGDLRIVPTAWWVDDHLLAEVRKLQL